MIPVQFNVTTGNRYVRTNVPVTTLFHVIHQSILGLVSLPSFHSRNEYPESPIAVTDVPVLR